MFFFRFESDRTGILFRAVTACALLAGKAVIFGGQHINQVVIVAFIFALRPVHTLLVVGAGNVLGISVDGEVVDPVGGRGRKATSA